MEFKFPTEQLPDGCLLVAGTGFSEKGNAMIGLLLTIIAPGQSWRPVKFNEMFCFLKSDRCRQIYISDEADLKLLAESMSRENLFSFDGNRLEFNQSRMESVLFSARISWYRL